MHPTATTFAPVRVLAQTAVSGPPASRKYLFSTHHHWWPRSNHTVRNSAPSPHVGSTINWVVSFVGARRVSDAVDSDPGASSRAILDPTVFPRSVAAPFSLNFDRFHQLLLDTLAPPFTELKATGQG